MAQTIATAMASAAQYRNTRDPRFMEESIMPVHTGAVARLFYWNAKWHNGPLAGSVLKTYRGGAVLTWALVVVPFALLLSVRVDLRGQRP